MARDCTSVCRDGRASALMPGISAACGGTRNGPARDGYAAPSDPLPGGAWAGPYDQLPSARAVSTLPERRS